jgi:hypothetical protein
LSLFLRKTVDRKRTKDHRHSNARANLHQTPFLFSHSSLACASPFATFQRWRHDLETSSYPTPEFHVRAAELPPCRWTNSEGRH